MKNRKVYHVNQNVFEYYQWNEAFKCYQNIDQYAAGDWKRGSFDFVELIHHGEKDKNGLYGTHIKW